MIAARKEDNVRAVVDLLAQHRIGAVPVMEIDQIIGIFSERDLVRLLSSYGVEALDRSLDEVMTKTPVTCELVIFGDGRAVADDPKTHPPPAGGRWRAPLRRILVSIGDLVKYRIDRIEAEAAAMREYIAS